MDKNLINKIYNDILEKLNDKKYGNNLKYVINMVKEDIDDVFNNLNKGNVNEE